MHINFRRIQLHNFLSFGDAELTFNDLGFVKVHGINNNPDDLAVSNGSGKSSLWEAIVWTLTGDTIRGTKQVTNLRGEDGCYCELEFDVDGKLYRLLRSKEHKVHKTSLQIFIDGKDCSGKGIRDSEKLLEQYLPDLTASLVGSVIILGQGLPQKFTNNTPSARKEILEKLSKSDFMIEDLKKKISDRKLFHQTEIRKFEDTILKCQTTISWMRDGITANQNALNNFIDISVLTEKVKAMEDIISGLDVELHQLDFEIQQAEIESEKLHVQLNELIDNQNIEIKSIESVYALDLDELRKEEITLVSKVNSLQHEIDRIKNIVDICPTCGQHIPNVNKPDSKPLEEEFNIQLDILRNHRTKISNVRKNEDLEIDQVYDKFNSQKDIINAKLNEVLEYKRKQNLLHIQKSQEMSNQMIEKTKVLNEIQTQGQRKLDLIADIERLEKDIQDVESQIVYNNSNKDLQQSKLDIINKFEVAVKRDFRGYLLLNIIDYIQTRAKYYASRVFDNDNIQFELDGNNIRIAYLNKEYENLSGGEKQKVDLILQFCIRDMLSNHLNFSSNILVLDEIFDNLDQIGCEKIIDMISDITDIKNIFIVTHRKDLSIPSDSEVVVLKSINGISEIQIR